MTPRAQKCLASVAAASFATFLLVIQGVSPLSILPVAFLYAAAYQYWRDIKGMPVHIHVWVSTKKERRAHCQAEYCKAYERDSTIDNQPKRLKRKTDLVLKGATI